MLEHYTSRKSLESAILLSKDLDYKLTVITHYSPVINESLDPKYHGKNKNDLYCTDMSKYFGSVETWIFGHTGFNCDISRNGCRILSNQQDVKTGTAYKKEAFSV